MKYFLLFLFVFSAHTMEIPKVLYGGDDRFNIEESPKTFYQTLGMSVAHMISEDLLSPAFEGVLTKVEVKTLSDRFHICPTERFAKDISAGNCSGFLVGPDLLVTAGHCIWGQESCDSNRWVFDFRNDFIYNGGNPDVAFVSTDDVYKCSEIINRKYNRETSKNDFALIRLDRPVTGRSPLKFRMQGQVEDNADIVMIGHPLGQTLKVAAKANITKNNNPFYFKTNLDSFTGNSGSPVFNRDTGLVEGILVRGELDFTSDSREDCDVVKRCLESGEGCLGEDVTRITVIPELVPGMTPPEDTTIEDGIEVPNDGFVDDPDDPFVEEINWDCYVNNINC